MSAADLQDYYGSPVPGTDREPGTDGTEGAVPRFPPMGTEPGTDGTEGAVPRFPPMGTEPGTDGATDSHPLYFDVARVLAEGLPEPEAPDMLTRSDGVGLFYRGQVNIVFGDPESGKTWVALAAVAETLRDGGTGLVLDLDHNGVNATLSRLLMLGAPVQALSDLSRFRYVEPEDSTHLVDVVADVIRWKPDVTVLDSIGELIPLFGANSNSPDDFTMVHAKVMKPLAAKAGTALIGIDHLAKGSESRQQGATGTAAKRRAIGGVSLRVSVSEAFIPGKGGSTALAIHKDRHGGLRAVCPGTEREPLAAMFVLSTIDEATTWSLRAPAEGERAPDQVVSDDDLAAMDALDPPPTTVEEARQRLSWRKDRAAKVLKEWRERQDEPAVPGSAPTPRNREPEPDQRVEQPKAEPAVPGSRPLVGNREPELQMLLCPGCNEPGCDGDCEPAM